MSSINRVSHLNRTYYTNKLKSSLTTYEYPDSPPLEIQYEVIKKNDGDSFKNNKLWAHLHCYNIDKFNDIYGSYIDRIIKHFSIIITYNIGETFPNLDIIILKVENRGYDIGPKFSMINYMNKNHINFEFVLMLHSKSYPDRNTYFRKILSKIDDIVSNLKDTDGIYTFNLLRDGRVNTYGRKFKVPWGNNRYHMNYIVNTYKLTNLNYIFPEGNTYILHSKIANYMYDNRFNIYKKLNNENTFDYSWFIQNYKLYHLSYSEAFNLFKKKNLRGNNLCAPYNGVRDTMIEHIFERIPFTVCEMFGKTIHILNTP